jgi:hypothetical protein
MDVYIPPVVAILGGLAAVGLCFAFRIPIFLLGVVSLILLVYTAVLNRNMFEIEYNNMKFGESIASLFNTIPSTGFVSILIITVVIILALGYILYLFGLSSLITNAPMYISSIGTSLMSSPVLATPASQYQNINTSARRNYASNFNRAL